MIREFREKSGLHLNSVEFAGFITFPKFEQIKDNWQVFFYICNDDFKGELKELDEGNLEWIDDEKILDLNLWDGDKLFLSWIKEKKKFFAKLTYKDSKLIKHEVDFL